MSRKLILRERLANECVAVDDGGDDGFYLEGQERRCTYHMCVVISSMSHNIPTLVM